MATELYRDNTHRCIRFDNLIGDDDAGTSQYLIIHGDQGILLDPGGNKLFSRLTAAMTEFLPPQKLEYIFLSHQDPDVGAGLNGYLLVTDAKICFSTIWRRFIPAFCVKSLAAERVIEIPDQGMRLPLNGVDLLVLPAHFLHSPGNLQVYDPISRTLFSGDIGASLMPAEQSYAAVSDFAAHIQYMDGFHRRYMPSGQVCRQWAEMVRALDLARIAPQHGAVFEGTAMAHQLIDWIAQLECGIDLMSKRNLYRLPQ